MWRGEGDRSCDLPGLVESLAFNHGKVRLSIVGIQYTHACIGYFACAYGPLRLV